MDLAIAVPESLLQREREIQVNLGFRLVHSGLTSPKADPPVHQIRNRTLKWTDLCGLDVSMLILNAEGVPNARLATDILRIFFQIV